MPTNHTTAADLEWGEEDFSIFIDEQNPWLPAYLNLPGGKRLNISDHDDPAINKARAEWMRDTLNAAKNALV